MADAGYGYNLEGGSYKGLMGLLKPSYMGSQSKAPEKEPDHYNDNSHVSDPWNKSFPDREPDNSSVPSVQPGK